MFIVLPILLFVVFAVLPRLIQDPPESTSRVPLDSAHLRLHNLVSAEGNKAAEAFCGDCHNSGNVAFPDGHPPKDRCLFCHKLEK